MAIGPLGYATHQPCPRGEGAPVKFHRILRLNGNHDIFTDVSSEKSNPSSSSPASFHRDDTPPPSLIPHSRRRRLLHSLKKERLLHFFKWSHRGSNKATGSAELGLPSPVCKSELDSELDSDTDIGDTELESTPDVIPPQSGLLSGETVVPQLFPGLQCTSELSHCPPRQGGVHNCPRNPRYGANFENYTNNTWTEDDMSTYPSGIAYQGMPNHELDRLESSSETSLQLDNGQRDGNDNSEINSIDRFACPLSKHNPERYRLVNCACTTRFGLSAVKKVTEHVKDVHLHNYKKRCSYCGDIGTTKPDCPRYRSRMGDMSQPEFLDPEQAERVLNRRSNRGGNPTQQWQALYLTLFPETEGIPVKPNPYYDYLVPNYHASRVIEGLRTELAELRSVQGPTDHTAQSPSIAQERELLGLPQTNHFARPRSTNTSPGCLSYANSGSARSPYSSDPATLQLYSDYGTGSQHDSYEHPVTTENYRTESQIVDSERHICPSTLGFTHDTWGMGGGLDQTPCPHHWCHGVGCQFHQHQG